MKCNYADEKDDPPSPLTLLGPHTQKTVLLGSLCKKGKVLKGIIIQYKTKIIFRCFFLCQIFL